MSFFRWLFPFIGHMGICTTAGVIRDFAGPYAVAVSCLSDNIDVPGIILLNNSNILTNTKYFVLAYVLVPPIINVYFATYYDIYFDYKLLYRSKQIKIWHMHIISIILDD